MVRWLGQRQSWRGVRGNRVRGDSKDGDPEGHWHRACWPPALLRSLDQCRKLEVAVGVGYRYVASEFMVKLRQAPVKGWCDPWPVKVTDPGRPGIELERPQMPLFQNFPREELRPSRDKCLG